MKQFSLQLRNGNVVDVTPNRDGTLDVHVTDQAGALLGEWSSDQIEEAQTVDGDPRAFDAPLGRLATVLHTATFRLVLTCETCGGRFGAKRATARYCSAACKVSAGRARKADA